MNAGSRSTDPPLRGKRRGIKPLELAWSGITVDLGGNRVLDNVDLKVAGGTWLSLIGPNGAGKTTMIRALAGTISHAGTITLGTKDVAETHHRERAQQVAVVPQHPLIPSGIPTFDYVLLGRTPHQGMRFSASHNDRQIVHNVLTRLGLLNFMQRRVETLSGGERQRVVLARALAQQSPVLVLDEPTSFLDVGHQMDVLELIAELQIEEALTVVTTLHDLSVAGQFADQVAVLAEGRLVANGHPVDVVTPETIRTHWGVDAHTDIDERGGVTVTVKRRRTPDKEPLPKGRDMP
ncbi:MAG: ABC transporter ATP-binding protein [Acidimicrobiales bacterium]|nr:ABC transporter ATP-binding protein [Acidimicrobiales bacterium]